MKIRHMLLPAICLLLTGAVETAAQTPAPTGPPAVLQIYREEVKQGKNTQHEAVEAGYVQAFAKNEVQTQYLGMASVSGPNEAWFLVAYDSFAAFEKDRRDIEKKPALQRQLDQLDQQDGEFRSGGRVMLAAYRKELSYHPERMRGLVPKSRYFSVLTVRMRQGHNAEFNEAVRMYLDAMEKANIEGGTAAYQILSGAPSGTYLIFVPLKSLAEMDAGPARDRAIFEALGAENGPKLLKLISESFLTTEVAHFAFSPKMSYVSKEFAAADPEFWTPKPKATAKAMASPKKQAAKIGGTQ